MVDRSSDVRCLFSARIEQRGGSYVLEIPDRELDLGTLTSGEIYQVGLYPQESDEGAAGSSGRQSTPTATRGSQPADRPEPPVGEGDRRSVTIEGVGEEGDGIAKVDRGYVLIVPDTEPGEQVEVEVTKTTENVGFAEVVGPGGR